MLNQNHNELLDKVLSTALTFLDLGDLVVLSLLNVSLVVWIFLHDIVSAFLSLGTSSLVLLDDIVDVEDKVTRSEHDPLDILETEPTAGETSRRAKSSSVQVGEVALFTIEEDDILVSVEVDLGSAQSVFEDAGLCLLVRGVGLLADEQTGCFLLGGVSSDFVPPPAIIRLGHDIWDEKLWSEQCTHMRLIATPLVFTFWIGPSSCLAR